MTMDTNEGRAKDALKPCPMCGKAVATVSTSSEMFPEVEDEGNAESYAVFCDAAMPGGPGGCGASGGFAPSEAEAIALWNTRASTPSPAPEVGGAGLYVRGDALGNVIEVSRYPIAAPQPAADVMGVLRMFLKARWYDSEDECMHTDIDALDAAMESARRALAAGAEPTVHPLDALLPDICQLIDTIKVEWTQQGCWSEWDQSVRDRIAAYNIAKMKGASGGADAAGAVPFYDHFQESAQAALKYKELYHELLFAVARKYPDETRHQTALRYIQRAEQSDQVDCDAARQSPAKGE